MSPAKMATVSRMNAAAVTLSGRAVGVGRESVRVRASATWHLALILLSGVYPRVRAWPSCRPDGRERAVPCGLAR